MRTTVSAVLLLVVALVSPGCRRATTPAAAASAGAELKADAAAGQPSAEGVFTGTVVESMDSGGYTYLRLRNGTDEVWVAAPEFDPTPNEVISAALDMPMRDFQSKTLNRTFPLLYFVEEIGRNGQTVSARPQSAPPSVMNSHGSAPSAPTVQAMEPPAGGLSVADVFARKAALSGKTVKVRGTIVKFNGGILDRNWFHIQDGSGTAETHDNDLTITSDATVKVGDVVTVSGTLGTSRDFGAGYAYDAILEQATLVAP